MAIDSVLILNLAMLLCATLLWWGVSLALRDVSIVDIFWGLGFVLVVWVSLGVSGSVSPPAFLLATLVSLWGIRLAGYLAWRNWGEPEDRRYAAMREKHGKRFPLVSLFTVFGLQGMLIWFISLPLQAGIVFGDSLHWAMAIGIALWLVGLFFESVGDYQLARFKSDSRNQGQVMNHGLWRYTRHPNYFGDFLVWWGLFVVAIASGAWWFTVICPLLMSVLLLRISGVTLLENSLKSRVNGYEEYVRRTSPFIPLPPKQV